MSVIDTKVEQDGITLRSPGVSTLPLGTAVRDLANTEAEAAALHALDELWQDGLVEEVVPGEWLVPYERLHGVEAATAHDLGLPAPDTSIQAEVRSSGVFTNDEFRIRLELRHPEHGALDPTQQLGPAFVLEGQTCILLSPELWRLSAAIADVPGAGAGTEDRAEHMGRVVEAALKADAALDSYLQENQLEVIRDVGLTPVEDGDEIQLSVSAGDGLSHSDLVLRNRRAAQFPHRRDPSGHQRRVVVSREARERIEAVARRHRIRGADVPRFLQNPEAFIPEGLDLSDFSERVRGFRTRVYNSRPYLHVNKEPRGWLDFDAGVRLEPTTGEEESGTPNLSIDEYKRVVEEARRTGERFIRYGDDWIEVDPDQADQFTNTVDLLRERSSSEAQLTASVVLDVIPNVDVLEFEVELPEEARAERHWVEQLPDITPPLSLQASLDSHQLLGFRWLSYLHDLGAGGLLADEMGVGKTAQVLALLAKLHTEDRLSPSLLVLPKTLIPNWQEELSRFLPSLDRVHGHTGPHRARSGDYLAGMNLVITTYDTARQDQVMLGSIDWKVIVADEAQFVKNPTAARTSVVKALKAEQALALTGTPVENGLIEFWCIMDYVQPGLLKSWSDFRAEFERPLIEAGSEDARQGLVDELQTRLHPHYLRRLKEEVLTELPAKHIDAAEPVGLSPIQRSRYQEILAETHERGSKAILGAITRLLRTCSHPRAGIEDWEGVPGESLISECPKLEQTIKILENIQARNEKALIFTEWKSTQKILQRAIWAHFGLTAEIVNGDVTVRRQDVLDQFRSQPGFGALILNPGVAGYGINLIEANHVIHYTRPWNPAKENQATDRVHRRGQQKPVTIYYPTVGGTVEDKLAQLLADKLELARDVLRPTRERTVSVEDLVDDLDLDPAVETS